MDYQHFDEDDISALQQRVQQLEMIMFEYLRLEHLIDQATSGHTLNGYGDVHIVAQERLMSSLPRSRGRPPVASTLIYVDPATEHIVDVNQAALDLMGYLREDMIGHHIGDFESQGEAATINLRTYVESSIQERVYQAFYRHQSGRQMLVHVSKRLLHKGEQKVICYRLEDQSPYGRLLRELKQREQYGAAIQKKLYLLMKITIELSEIRDFDALCRHGVVCAIQQLGFDRLGIWFLDKAHQHMIGSYGVDETGQIRSEHGQQWSYQDTYIEDFLAGHTELAFAYDESPLYNNKSEIIDYGWHISVPLVCDNELLGVLTADNYLHKQPINDYEPELLRLYGMTLGYLLRRLSPLH